MFEHNMTCKKTYIQTKPFLFIVQLTGNCIFQPLDFEKLCCHRESCRHVFAQAGGSQGAKDRKQRKVPQAHYGTNNPSPVWGMVEPTGRLPSQPGDLWQRPEVRLRGEVLPSLRGGNFADVATSHCQKKIPQKKEQFRPNRGKKEPRLFAFFGWGSAARTPRFAPQGSAGGDRPPSFSANHT